MNGWCLIISGAVLCVAGLPASGAFSYLMCALGGFCVGWGIVKVKNGT